MAPAIAASLVSGGAGLLGGIMQNNANKQLQADANAANERLAADNHRWMEMMSGTAHQREVADLKAAGLNPILSATGGSGAAAPSVSQATHSAARVEDVLSKGISSAKMAYDTDLATRSLKGDLALKEASAASQAASAVQSATTAKKTAEETKGVAIDNAVKTTSMPALKKESELREKKAEYDKSAAGYDAIVNRALDLIGGISGAAGKFFRPEPTGAKYETMKTENRKMKDYINRNQGRSR